MHADASSIIELGTVDIMYDDSPEMLSAQRRGACEKLKHHTSFPIQK
jgi:hypothetical protein